MIRIQPFLYLVPVCYVLSLSIRELHHAVGSFRELYQRVGWNEEHITALEALLASALPSRYGLFELDNLEYVRCGAKKCFAQFRSNPVKGFIFPHLRADIIWNETTRDMAQSFNETYFFGGRLEQDFGIPNMFLEPPRYLVETDENWRQAFNVKFLNQLNKPMATNRSLLIQVVKSIARPYLLFQHWKLYAARNMTDFVEFLERSAIDDKEAFARNLLSGLNTTRHVVGSDEYHCLNYDFQMIVDYQGRVHLIDLDQCFESEWSKDPSEEAIKGRIILMNTFEKCFLDALQAYNVSAIVKRRKIRPYRSCQWW